MSWKLKALPFITLLNGRSTDTCRPNFPSQVISQASDQVDLHRWDGVVLRNGVNFLRRFIGAFITISLIFAVTSVASARDITRTIDVDGNFGEGSVKFTDTGAGIEYRIQIIVVDDVIEFCGAFAYRGKRFYRSASDQVLHFAKLTMNGKTILRDFRFFRAGTRSKPWEGQKADCVPRASLPLTKNQNSTSSSGKSNILAVSEDDGDKTVIDAVHVEQVNRIIVVDEAGNRAVSASHTAHGAKNSLKISEPGL